jgi:hypothetical protein
MKILLLRHATPEWDQTDIPYDIPLKVSTFQLLSVQFSSLNNKDEKGLESKNRLCYDEI